MVDGGCVMLQDADGSGLRLVWAERRTNGDWAPTEPLQTEPLPAASSRTAGATLSTVYIAADNRLLSVELAPRPPRLQLLQLPWTNSVKRLSCGKGHVAMIDGTGTVWTMGLGSHGQLGLGDVESRAQPGYRFEEEGLGTTRMWCLMLGFVDLSPISRVEALLGLEVADVQCGGWHTLALTATGDVYSCGWNKHGQLGEGDFRVKDGWLA